MTHFHRYGSQYFRGGAKQRTSKDKRRVMLAPFLTGDSPASSVMPDNWVPNYDVGALGNDRYGCCMYAAPAHFINLIRMRNGDGRLITETMVLKAYADGTGFDPADPSTDDGAYALDVMKKWASPEGLYGTRIEAFAEVDLANDDEVAFACSTLGGVIGAYGIPVMDLDDKLWNVPDTGYPNGMGPWTRGGHAMHTHQTSPGRDHVVTWGYRQGMTPRWRRTCGSEGYAVLFSELVGTGRSIAGLDADGLLLSVEAVRAM